ncbi:dual specificity protein phosphatase MPK-4 isoform X2 [Arctopsyche grandis]|uniref:dual specificity protein phosphatase MPK-4 isoform X2 n=1 Tax=Arctopsyche grandis TaxID=121162 RepID=UPI00406D9A8B
MSEEIFISHPVNSSAASTKNKGSSMLSRDDFDSGPVSLDLIEDNLWLGNLKAACDSATLHSRKITHILTVDSVPLPRANSELKNITTKYVQDIPKEDLICHFTETNEFIKEGQENGAILVHCYFGMSRSAAVVIAYMMAKHKLLFEEAFYIVKAKRSITCPNNGFISQLKLYGQMQCVLDKNHPKYKKFRLKMAAENFRKVKILSQNCADLVKPDPGLIRERPDPLVYRCKKCRRIVASQKNIISHIPHNVKLMLSQNTAKKKEEKAEGQEKWDLTCNSQNLIDKLKSLACSNGSEDPNNEAVVLKIESSDNILNKSSSSSEGVEVKVDEIQTNHGMDTHNKDIPEICVQTYFIEPLAWMKDIHKNVQGKLYCPKCSNKLGSFSWIMGCQCPCGSKVAPAFYLVPSKVELSNVVQNVQVTV